ncbi:hypothetical protein EXU57_15025 [Segetibacter sp. 3557_3]|uniref:hypothetical protein n=1 Tax=Segetibacter sp. 3557_3 TaxID=2547429 RepID=UPI001058B33A|nr:hypothetical protein [Segetibacter sp. 3557_3]TDH24646.1 hypothetical protein EXU57_15025 [Segetibacter sp. 3557_3]
MNSHIFWFFFIVLGFTAKNSLCGQGIDSALTFTLSEKATTSAGIYKKDTLIKTLWSGRMYEAGTFQVNWDGTDDAGKIADSGDYNAKVISNNIKANWEGVVGNTSSSKVGSGVHRGYSFMSDMCITGGNIYYATQYDELRKTQHKASTSNPNVAIPLYGAGHCDSYLVCSDGINVYWGSRGQIGGEYNKFFIFGTKVNDDKRVSFPNGQNIDLDYSKGSYNCFAYCSNLSITDITVQKGGNFFFVAEATNQNLVVYNKTTGALIQNLFVPGIKSVATDSADGLWIGTSQEIRNYRVNVNGTLSEKSLIGTFSDLKAIELNTKDNLIVAADGGDSQQLIAYSTLDGSVIWTLGKKGGYLNGPEVGNEKFYFDALSTFISFDRDGSFWVKDGMNYRVQQFDSSRVFINRIMYCPNTYAVALDKGDSSRAFLKFLEFKIDYSKPLLPNNGSWQLVKNWATPGVYGAYDNNFVCLSDVVTLQNKRTYCFAYNIKQDRKELVELIDRTGLRPIKDYYSGIANLYPDGIYYVTPETSVVNDTVKWIKHSLLGFGSDDNPRFGPPIILAKLLKNETDPVFNGNRTNGTFGEIQNENIITFDGGAALNPFESKGYHLGALNMRTNKFTFKTAYNTSKTYAGEFPSDERYDVGNETNYPGSQARVCGDFIVQGHHGEFWKGGQTNEYKLFFKNGLLLRNFGTNVQKINRDLAAPAEMAGNALTICLTRVDKSIYMYHGDESYHSGLHRWKISGIESVREQIIPITRFFKRTAERPVLPGIDLLEKLPIHSILPDSAAGWTRHPTKDEYTRHDQYWSVKTNVKTYDDIVSPDLFVQYQHTQSPFIVNRKLGDYNQLLSWKLYGTVSYENNNPNMSFGTSMYLQVLDNAGKILVRFFTTLIWSDFPVVNLYANNTLIFTGSRDEVFSMMNKFQSIEFTMEDRKISVKYGKFESVTVKSFDAEGDLMSPKTLQLYFDYVNGPAYIKTIDFAKMRFTFHRKGTYYRTRASGEWIDIASWQASSDNQTWSNASTVPDSSANSIVIQPEHTISLNDTIVVDQLNLLPGAVLNLHPNAQFIVNDGPDDDIIINPGAKLNLKSDCWGTGSIGSSTGTIRGEVTVEHFISSSSSRKNLLLAPIVNTIASVKPFIRDNWQEGQTNLTINNNTDIKPGFGTHITGSGPTGSGFDPTATAVSSLSTFNQAAPSQGWVPVLNTNATTLDAKKGYLIYIRGSRSYDLSKAYHQDSSWHTTLRTTGTLLTGDQVFSNLEGRGRSSLVTNPYACVIDWKKIYTDTTTANAAHFESTYTFWDPNTQGYRTVDANSTDTSLLLIKPGTAFFIKAKAGAIAPTLTIKETHKVLTFQIHPPFYLLKSTSPPSGFVHCLTLL